MSAWTAVSARSCARRGLAAKSSFPRLRRRRESACAFCARSRTKNGMSCPAASIPAALSAPTRLSSVSMESGWSRTTERASNAGTAHHRSRPQPDAPDVRSRRFSAVLAGLVVLAVIAVAAVAILAFPGGDGGGSSPLAPARPAGEPRVQARTPPAPPKMGVSVRARGERRSLGLRAQRKRQVAG